MSITRRATLALVTAATTLSLISGAAMAQDNYKERIRIFYETFNTGDASLLDRIIAEDWVSIPVNPGKRPRPRRLKEDDPGLCRHLCRWQDRDRGYVQEGNKVAVRSTYTATQIGPFAGFPAQNRPFAIMTIDIHEFNDEGMVQTTWHLEDWLGGLFQMGAFEQ